MSTHAQLFCPDSSVAKKRNSRSGQGAIEYILMTIIIVGVIVGVIYPAVQGRFEQIQNTMAQRTARVISQENTPGQGPFGIPREWFFGNGAPDFNAVGQRLAAAEAGAAGGGGRGGSGRGGRNGDKNGEGDDGEGGDSANSGPSAGAGGSGSFGSGNANPSAGANSSGRGNLAPDENQGEAAVENDSKGGGRRGGGSSDSGFDGDTEGGNKAQKLGGELSEDAKKDPTGGGVTGRIKRMARPEETESGGCSNVNFFTILKIIALLIVLFIAGAIMVSSRRGKGNG